MEKKTMFALAAMAAATSAFAATFEYKPTASTPLPYDWSDATYWSPYNGNLPSSSDDTWMTSTMTKDHPLYINSGTAAETRTFRLSNTAARSDPQQLIINGGSLTTYNVAYLGYRNAGTLTLQNGGTFEAKSTTYIGYINTSSSSGNVRVFDAKVIVADAESTFTAANTVYIGSQIGGTALLENRGTVNISGALQLGVCTNAAIARGDLVAIVTNSGSMTVAQDKDMSIGWMTNNVGMVENTGNLTLGQHLILARLADSEGRMRHSAGTLTVAKSVFVGYTGSGYLELSGDTETAFPAGSFAIAQNNWNHNEHSRGELVITNSASLSRCDRSINAAVYNNATARIALYDNAKLSDCSLLSIGNIKTDNSFEVYDNAVVSNIDVLVLNVGSSSSGVTGKTTMKLSGNAKVCDIRNAYIGSNQYNQVELEIADNAWFGLCDDAWGTNIIKVATANNRVGDATIRLRGGKIALGIRGRLQLGDTNDSAKDGCPAKLVGYGCVTNQGDRSKTVWSRIDIRSGSATADGEGVERDLDLTTFASVTGSSGDGRAHLNSSGTNGWYAVNKGRLRYPNMDGELLRFVGEYPRLTAGFQPKLVNAMKIILKDANDTEVEDHRRFNVAMYAPDRTDIPAGLVEDDAKDRRLGIWKGNVTGNAKGKFATAEATIRYDQWRLGELKDGVGNYPAGLEVILYKHDGSVGGRWQKVAAYPAADAATNEFRIGGDIASVVSGSHNLSWFAVVAKFSRGTCLIVR